MRAATPTHGYSPAVVRARVRNNNAGCPRVPDGRRVARTRARPVSVVYFVALTTLCYRERDRFYTNIFFFFFYY